MSYPSHLHPEARRATGAIRSSALREVFRPRLPPWTTHSSPDIFQTGSKAPMSLKTTHLVDNSPHVLTRVGASGAAPNPTQALSPQSSPAPQCVLKTRPGSSKAGQEPPRRTASPALLLSNAAQGLLRDPREQCPGTGPSLPEPSVRMPLASSSSHRLADGLGHWRGHTESSSLRSDLLTPGGPQRGEQAQVRPRRKTTPSGEVWGGHPSLNSAELGPHPSLRRSLHFSKPQGQRSASVPPSHGAGAMRCTRTTFTRAVSPKADTSFTLRPGNPLYSRDTH